MRQKILYAVFTGVAFLIPFASASAQIQEPLESCFHYYRYGGIKVDARLQQSSYNAGDTGTLYGTITNDNTSPLLHIILYAQLYRLDKATSSGFHLVDRLILQKDLNFLPSETKPIQMSLPLKKTYPPGLYELRFFLFSAEGFHYGGRPFIENDTAGYTRFTLTGGNAPLVYFDQENLLVNGQRHTITEPISEFGSLPLTFSLPIKGLTPRSTPKTITVRWYYFDDSQESNLLKTEQTAFDSSSQTVTTTFNLAEPGAYSLLVEMNDPSQSLLKYRFARKGEAATTLRINSLGVTNFPLANNDRAYACFHSPMNVATQETKLAFLLLDATKNVVATTTQTQNFPSDVLALSLPTNKLTTKDDFWIVSEVTSPNKPTVTTELHYSCNIFQSAQKDILIDYNPQTPDVLNLTPLGACGKPLDRGGYIERLRLRRGDQLVQEAYFLTSIPRTLSLSSQEPGLYHLEVKSGLSEQTLGFTRSQGKKREGLWKVVGIMILMIILILSYFVRQHWKEKEKLLLKEKNKAL